LKAVLLFSFAAWAAVPAAAQAIEWPRGADALLVPIDDSKLSFGERTRGKVAVVELWTTWCVPCRRTIPELERLARERSEDGLVVVGVNVGEERGRALKLLRSLGASYPQYLDPDYRFTDALGARGIPTIVVLDRAGRLVDFGAALDPERLRRIEALLSPL